MKKQFISFCLLIVFLCSFYNFIPNFSSAAFVDSNLPLIVLHTFGQTLSLTKEVEGKIRIFSTSNNGRYSLEDLSFDEYDVRVRIRGHSTSEFPKKPFSIEFFSKSKNKTQEVQLFGFGKDSDFALKASYTDKTFVRDTLTFDIGNQIAAFGQNANSYVTNGWYAPKYKYVELFWVDDVSSSSFPSNSVIENNYYDGIYILEETVKREKDRLNIKKYNSTEDITGGFLLQVDRIEADDVYCDNTETKYIIKYPKLPSSKEKTYICNYMRNLERKIGDDIDDVNGGVRTRPSSGTPRYASLLNLGSVVDYFLIQEFNKNVDQFRLSLYFYKDAGKPLAMGPLWDFDLAWGNANYRTAFNTTGFMYDASSILPWMKLLTKDPYFIRRINCRWQELRNGPLSKNNIYSKIDQLIEVLDEAKERNFKRWKILGKYIWPNPQWPSTYEGEISYLKDFIRDRGSWLDSHITALDRWNPQCSICGNGVVDSGEDCDSNSPCCDQITCKYKSNATICRVSSGSCDVVEICTGKSSTCPIDTFVPDNTTCDDADPNTSNDVCLNGVCSGEAITLCGNGFVDIGEDCDSNLPCCDQSTCKFKANDFVCISETGNCDVSITCSGTSDSCPNIGNTAPDNTPCDDADPDTLNDVCINGNCRGEIPGQSSVSEYIPTEETTASSLESENLESTSENLESTSENLESTSENLDTTKKPLTNSGSVNSSNLIIYLMVLISIIKLSLF